MTALHSILQDNIFSEEGFEQLVTALERLECSYSIHKVIPFAGEITDPQILEAKPPGTKFITMGSYSLARWARTAGFSPGAFLDNLDFVEQRAHWGERMLNADAHICGFAEVPERSAPFFLRPVHDTKSFTGLVIDWARYVEWRDQVLALPPEDLHGAELAPSTPVMVCGSKDIYSETRTWIVGGRVVTASGYKLGALKRYSPPDMVDGVITSFAQVCADDWSPNDAYVLDVADTEDGLRIVEVNNINSAGWYKADLNRLVQAIEDLLV